MKLIEITTALEAFAPLSLQENYDNAGLLTGDYEQEISQAMLCLDVTEAVLEEAITTGCNLVIAHHPVIFSGIKKITGSNYVERILLLAIRHHIAIYAAHTNLDNLIYGVNAKIAERLNLQDLKVLSAKNDQLMKLFTFVPVSHAEQVRAALFNAGAGSIGNYDECSFNVDGMGTFRGNDSSNAFVGEKGKRHIEPETKIEVVFPRWRLHQLISALRRSHPYEEVAYDIVALVNPWHQTGAGLTGKLKSPMKTDAFLKYLKEKLSVKIIRHTTLCKNTVSTVAICGGAGSFLLRNAIDAGADIFISADFKYHQFFDADNAIIIADIGHFESEQFTPEIFADVLRQKFPTFAVRFTSINTNPINYY
ncbi:MAG: Nif3-like dinuclear metal center hexameric protein [Chitinophagaceae bacterium]|nr:Nif3-like dinuclear metal center hexameric protein [Chitinophagaceae bacterium]